MILANITAMPPSKTLQLDPAIYNSFVDDLELVGIELIKIHGERTASGIAVQSRFNLMASFMRGEGAIHYRYEATADFVDDKDVTVGNAIASVQVTIRAQGEVNDACIEQFGATSGALMVHPYLREAIASTAQRIGFPGVLLPVIKDQPAE